MDGGSIPPAPPPPKTRIYQVFRERSPDGEIPRPPEQPADQGLRDRMDGGTVPLGRTQRRSRTAGHGRSPTGESPRTERERMTARRMPSPAPTSIRRQPSRTLSGAGRGAWRFCEPEVESRRFGTSIAPLPTSMVNVRPVNEGTSRRAGCTGYAFSRMASGAGMTALRSRAEQAQTPRYRPSFEDTSVDGTSSAPSPGLIRPIAGGARRVHPARVAWTGVTQHPANARTLLASAESEV